ncbi:MAG TPA: hypothetical protein VNS52_12880 [Gemmatimonadaceae bacterium]|nr:hypothetical protein [Gemmatimonadaceae bacterium]
MRVRRTARPRGTATVERREATAERRYRGTAANVRATPGRGV